MERTACGRRIGIVELPRSVVSRFGGKRKMSVALKMTLLLIGSNVFMTFAWYAHLKNLHDRKWYIAAIVSWGIALFEYLLQVPANRIGYTQRGAVKDHSGGDHSFSIRTFCHAVSA
jgi:Putative member of DMT superfamily (DUF486)